MTQSNFLKTPAVTQAEKKLESQKDPRQRIVLLDELASFYAYTDTKRAIILLDELNALLKLVEFEEFADFRLNHLIYCAAVENQLYNYEKAALYYLEVIPLMEERGDSNDQAEVYIDYAGVCMNLDKLEEAHIYLDKATRELKLFPNEQLQSRLISREGYLNLKSKNWPAAIELFLGAEKKINALPNMAIKDYYFLTLTYSGLGKVYEMNAELEKTIFYYRKVLEMCLRENMLARISWHYLNLGLGYMTLGNLEDAEPYFKKAIDTTDDESQLPRAMAVANLGYCRLEQRNYEGALELFEAAETIFRELKAEDFRNFSMIAGWRGRTFHEQGEIQNAILHYQKALQYAREIDDYKQLFLVCKDLAGLYAEQKEYKNAYEYQVWHDGFYEKYMEDANNQKIKEIEVRYEAEKKKQEAEMHKLRATKLQLKALRAQMNPHFMYNALNSIQKYITSNEITFASKYLAKFANLMRQSLDNSDLEIISLEKEIEFLDNYLSINEKLRFEDKLSYKISVEDDIEEDILGVPTMIVQPYVENAIEHGLRSIKNGFVKVNFSVFDEDTILCVVEDNGIGRVKASQLKMSDPRFQNHRSRGTNITLERLRILHSSEDENLVKIVDLKDETTGKATGTRVEIKIPIVEVQVK